MPPAVDVQTLRPVAGEEWRWVDTRPEEGLVPMFTAMGSSGLLTVEDRDERWDVSSALVDLDPSLSWRRGAMSVVADVPLRGEWGGQVNVADPRFAVLAHAGAWTARVGGIAPWGGMGWPFSWNDWRIEGAASGAGRWLAATVGVSHGGGGTVVRSALGARWRNLTAEIAGAKGGEVPLQTAEVTASARLLRHGVTLLPFVSVGVSPTPGTPALRVGLTLAPARTPAALPPVPVPTPELAPAPPPATPEPAPAPLPATPEPVPPQVMRVRIEQRPACSPKEDEQLVLERMTQRAIAYLQDRGVTGASIEIAMLPCEPSRSVDLVVVEVR